MVFQTMWQSPEIAGDPNDPSIEQSVLAPAEKYIKNYMLRKAVLCASLGFDIERIDLGNPLPILPRHIETAPDWAEDESAFPLRFKRTGNNLFTLVFPFSVGMEEGSITSSCNSEYLSTDLIQASQHTDHPDFVFWKVKKSLSDQSWVLSVTLEQFSRNHFKFCLHKVVPEDCLLTDCGELS